MWRVQTQDFNSSALQVEVENGASHPHVILSASETLYPIGKDPIENGVTISLTPMRVKALMTALTEALAVIERGIAKDWAEDNERTVTE